MMISSRPRENVCCKVDFSVPYGDGAWSQSVYFPESYLDESFDERELGYAEVRRAEELEKQQEEQRLRDAADRAKFEQLRARFETEK